LREDGSYNLIPEKDDFLKRKCPRFAWIFENMNFVKKNLLVLPEFLKNKFWEISTLLKKNPLKMSEFLKNKYFFNEISPSYILIPENDRKCPSFARIPQKKVLC
jgi:hypothetical protein